MYVLAEQLANILVRFFIPNVIQTECRRLSCHCQRIPYYALWNDFLALFIDKKNNFFFLEKKKRCDASIVQLISRGKKKFYIFSFSFWYSTQKNSVVNGERIYEDCLHQIDRTTALARNGKRNTDCIGELLWNDIYWPNRRYEFVRRTTNEKSEKKKCFLQRKQRQKVLVFWPIFFFGLVFCWKINFYHGTRIKSSDSLISDTQLHIYLWNSRMGDFCSSWHSVAEAIRPFTKLPMHLTSRERKVNEVCAMRLIRISRRHALFLVKRLEWHRFEKAFYYNNARKKTIAAIV